MGDPLKTSLILDIINGEVERDSGTLSLGQTVKKSYIQEITVNTLKAMIQSLAGYQIILILMIKLISVASLEECSSQKNH